MPRQRPRVKHHGPKLPLREHAHAGALIRGILCALQYARERSEEVELRGKERDLLRGELGQRALRVHEARGDDFLPAIGRREALLLVAVREAGGARVVEEGEVELRVKSPAGRVGNKDVSVPLAYYRAVKGLAWGCWEG